MTQPIHAFNLWTSEEETLLLRRSTMGISMEAIAVIHGRTRNAIRRRLEQIAWKHLQKGGSKEHVARLTGLPIKHIEKLQNEKGKTSVTSKYRMRNSQTLSRAELQAIPAQRRLATIQEYVSRHIYQSVYGAAAAGKTSYLYVLPKTTPHSITQQGQYIVTPSDMVEGLIATFPDCKVSFSEEWVDVRPNVRELQSGILIDWS